MADTTKYGNAVEFDVDLHSIYAAYMWVYAILNWIKLWLTLVSEVFSNRQILIGGRSHGEGTLCLLTNSWDLAGK